MLSLRTIGDKSRKKEEENPSKTANCSMVLTNLYYILSYLYSSDKQSHCLYGTCSEGPGFW